MTAKGRTKNILLIDENLAFANKIKKSIDLLGYRITVSNNPDLAVEAFQRIKFDLVISDCTFPGNPPSQIIERIRLYDKSVPVFITSDKSDLGLKENSLVSGASDFFSKQFDIDRLLLQICKLP